MLVVVVVLLFLVLMQGLTKVSDQSRALEDRNDSNNSLEVYTPNSFIHLFYCRAITQSMVVGLIRESLF